MKSRLSVSRKIFLGINYTALICMSVLCVLPLVNVLAISFSSKAAVAAGYVAFWPIDFSLSSYEIVMKKVEFFNSFFVSVKRTVLGVTLNMVLCVLAAYPLSKEADKFRWRKYYVWFFVITMLFSGGLIPTYMVVRYTGLIDTIFSLVIPNAVSVFYVLILLNFFRGLPKEIEEAAFIDGAGHWTALIKIYLPLSVPSLATIALFSIVGHWNAWFDGIIYSNKISSYPLQSYLRTVVINANVDLTASLDTELFNEVSDRTAKAAQIFIAALPVLLIYPFLQKYFTTGLVMGSVKG